MPDFYFSPSNSRVLIRRHGGDAVWVDDACGISYDVRAPMYPLYGYGDYRFTKVARGKEVVTGHLLMNYRYKNQLTFALLAPKQPKSAITIENTQDWRPIAARAMEAFTKLTTIIKDPEVRSNFTNEYIDTEEKKFVFVSSKIDANQTAWVEWGQAKKEASRLGVNEENLEDLSRRYWETLVAFPTAGTAIEFLRSPQTVIDRLRAADLDTKVFLVEEVRELISGIDRNVISADLADTATADRYKNSLWRRTRRSFSAAQLPPYHESFSNEQQRYDLIVEFGHPDEFGTDRAPDHQIQIETLYFTGESMHVRVDDDDNVKTAFPFLAKQVT